MCLLDLLRACCESRPWKREDGARHSKLGGGSIGDGDVVDADEFGSMLTKLYVVDAPALPFLVELVGLRKGAAPSRESDALRVGPSFASFFGPSVFFSSSSSMLCAALFDFGMGNERPRSFPLLATPTPHVSCVL